MADTKILEFYRGSGHCAEKMIREFKNGFDLKNISCQKLSANKAYGLIAFVSSVEFSHFKVDDHIAVQFNVVEKKVGIEVVADHLEVHLFPKKGEALASFN